MSILTRLHDADPGAYSQGLMQALAGQAIYALALRRFDAGLAAAEAAGMVEAEDDRGAAGVMNFVAGRRIRRAAAGQSRDVAALS